MENYLEDIITRFTFLRASPVTCQNRIKCLPCLILARNRINLQAYLMMHDQVADLSVVAARAAQHPHHRHATPDCFEHAVPPEMVDEQFG